MLCTILNVTIQPTKQHKKTFKDPKYIQLFINVITRQKSRKFNSVLRHNFTIDMIF